jgi:peroxiredoxin
MPKIALNAPAPEFIMQDYQGNMVNLSHFKGQHHVLLIFNRGFS